MHPIVEECKQVSKSTTTMYHEYPKRSQETKWSAIKTHKNNNLSLNMEII